MTCSSSTISIARIAAAALAALVLGGPVRGDVPAGLLAKARAAIAKRDGIAAEAPLRAAMRLGASVDDVRAELGEALLLQGDRREARRVLFGGDFRPESAAHGWQLRGRIELIEGRLAAAGQAFDQSWGIAPDNASLWVDIARLRFSGGEQAQAIEAAERAVKLDPKDPRALELRGLLVREQFGLQAALPWFEAGLRVAPDDAGLLGEYAATLGDMGQYRAMLVVCRKLAKVDPGNVRALYLQAVLAARAGQTDLARKILLQTGTALRDMPAAMLLNGILEYRAGNANLAVGHFDRLLRVQPDNLQARMLMVRALERQGLHQQASEIAAGWARQSFAPPYLLALAADAEAGLGRKGTAASFRERAKVVGQRAAMPIGAGQPLPVLALAYGDAPNFAANAVPYIRGLIESGNTAQAVGVADRLRLANPGAAEAWLLAGDARLMSGDRAGALDQYGRAALIRFNLPTLQRIDHVMRLLGKPAEANGMVARYLRQNPASPQALKLLSAGRAALGDGAGAGRIESVLAERGLRNPS
ncbi:tetratricopeptide repeat protein [Novosphingobium jiangmenense]|uniref:Tetratricopeptide repeat protein n=1 Tax=Novosphingobium jiangmenense TaxID=2791981 RepID=A0ABS0HD10_9SPHN|nr:tetratricopeptide repeat protein [Novosphingobium jiangmenense]MBF9150102.1 tetratricopeptide repeat protein [Novosphingobium jiangmenense]